MLVNESFENNTMQPNFTRDIFKTIAEMKAVPKKKMPKMLISACLETGKIYVYNKNGEVDETLGLWREIGFAKNEQGDSGTGEGSEGVSSSSDYLSVEGDNNTVYLVSSGNKSEVSPDDIFSYENLPLYIIKDGFDSDIELRYVGGISGEGKTGPVFASQPFLEDDIFKNASSRKLLMYTTELIVYRHLWYMKNLGVREIGGSCDCQEETDTVDFSTWSEFVPDLEAGDIVLDGQGGAIIDDSNVSVDPGDIEPGE